MKKNWIICAGLSLNVGTLTYAFTANCMNDALDTMILVFGIKSDTPLFKSILTTVYYVGCLFGAILSKWMERYHRSIVCVDLLFCLGSGIMIFDNFKIFIIGRFITGLGGGIQSVCLGLYLRQFTPTELYSTNAGMLSSIFSIGYLITMVAGTFFEDTKDKTVDDINPYFWRAYFLFGAIPSFLRLVLLLTYYNFETPVFYLKNNQDKQALRVLKKQYANESQIFDEINRLKEYRSDNRNVNYLRQPYLEQFKFGLFLVFFSQFNGYNAVLQYSNTIFQDAYSEKISKDLTFAIAVLKTIFYSITAQFLTGKFGRHRPLIIGSIIMTIGHFGIASFSFLKDYTTVSYFVFLYLFGQFTSTGPIVQIYLPEITPGNSLPVCYWLSWGCAIVILWCFPILKEWIGQTYIFIFFGVITIFCGIYQFLYGVETLHKTNQEVHEIFRIRSLKKRQYQNVESDINENIIQ